MKEKFTSNKPETLYRGVVLPLNSDTINTIKSDTKILPREKNVYKNSANGIHTSGDIKTARLYADAGSFIVQQKSDHTNFDKDNWTIGVVHEINNKDNQLNAKVATPKGILPKVDKFIAHYIMGRTEFVVPEIPEGSSEPKEIYLFRGDILHAKFTDKEIALTALTGHLKYLETEGEQGEFIEKHDDNKKIERRVSTIDSKDALKSAIKFTLGKIATAAYLMKTA